MRVISKVNKLRKTLSLEFIKNFVSGLFKVA